MSKEIDALIQAYRELVKSEYEGCASFNQRMAIADRAESRLRHMKMRLAQIASGDYKACGASAELTAKDALRDNSEVDWKAISAICL